MSKKKSKFSNLLFIVLIALLLIPQTRLFFQVQMNKLKVGLNLFKPDRIASQDQSQVTPFEYKLRALDGIFVNSPIGKGKVSFISYWATWCGPCIAELPGLEKLYADYGNRVNFLFITNEEPDRVLTFLEKKELNIPAVNPRMNTPETLYESSIPTNYIIDKKGNIVVKEQGAVNWNTPEIRTLLDTLLES